MCGKVTIKNACVRLFVEFYVTLRNFTQNFGVVRIKNPYKKAQEQLIEVYPVSYQMNFDANVIEKRYAD